MDFQRLEHVVRRLSLEKDAAVDDEEFYAAGLRFAAQEMGDDPVEYGSTDIRDRAGDWLMSEQAAPPAAD